MCTGVLLQCMYACIVWFNVSWLDHGIDLSGSCINWVCYVSFSVKNLSQTLLIHYSSVTGWLPGRYVCTLEVESEALPPRPIQQHARCLVTPDTWRRYAHVSHGPTFTICLTPLAEVVSKHWNGNPDHPHSTELAHPNGQVSLRQECEHAFWEYHWSGMYCGAGYQAGLEA